MQQTGTPGVPRPASLTKQSWVVALLLAVGAAGAVALEQAQPAPGSRVRLGVEADARPLEGTVAEWTDNSLSVTLSDEGGTIAIPRAEIVRLEMQTRPSRRRMGALIGAGIVAGVLGAFAYGTCGTHCHTGATVGGILLSSAVGGGLGALVAGDARWEAVPLAHVQPRNGPRISLGMTPGGGVAGSLSIRF